MKIMTLYISTVNSHPLNGNFLFVVQDVFSTFSSDSGNVHDFLECPEYKHHGSSGHMPKSKSMPDYQDAQKQDAYSSMTGLYFYIAFLIKKKC